MQNSARACKNPLAVAAWLGKRLAASYVGVPVFVQMLDVPLVPGLKAGGDGWEPARVKAPNSSAGATMGVRPREGPRLVVPTPEPPPPPASTAVRFANS